MAGQSNHAVGPARAVRCVAALVLACALSACQSARNLALLAPASWIGMDEVAADVRVEAGGDAGDRERALRARDAARARLVDVLGEVRTRPTLVFCRTDDCYRRFGGGTSRAKSFGDRLLFMGPAGGSAAYVAHEWWHAELYDRLPWNALRAVPRWFDEGAAVWVSDDPRYGDAMYRRVIAQGIVPPPLERLVGAEDFSREVERYGDHLWAGRPADAVTVVYPTAAREVRRWMSVVGVDGLRALVGRLAAGEPFDAAYRDLEAAARPATPPQAK
jgi:hypothetical protein